MIALSSFATAVAEVAKTRLAHLDCLRADRNIWDFEAALAIGKCASGSIALHTHESARQPFARCGVANYSVKNSDRAIKG